MNAIQKLSKEEKAKLKKALWEHIRKSEAFKVEVMNGADFYETAEKYGKKFVAPIRVPDKK